MKLFKIFLLSLTLMIIPATKTSPVNLFKIVLGTTVTVGSTASFLFWLNIAIEGLYLSQFPHRFKITRETVLLVGVRLLIDALAATAGVALVVSAHKKNNKKTAKNDSEKLEETTAIN